ncbi:hypothetical protein HMSSN036_17980 [Paenibacillus macerans]|nr:hypothetical protein HMSSN036_17980 [Paenibacillus macerans]
MGSDGNWSQTGRFTTEGNTENEYDFLYMTDSQGANTEDYRVWANSLKNALDDYPDARFLVMPGDLVDAGANEGQWSDYFGQPQDLLMNLPLMATIGNHEGPNNNNFFYHLICRTTRTPIPNREVRFIPLITGPLISWY